jgi:5-carboxymethyl-2-hydroxymuconate isomerase
MIANMGLSEDAADKFMEFAIALNDGRITEKTKRTASNTTATSAEEFSNVFKNLYEHS